MAEINNRYFLFVNRSGYFEFDLEVTDFVKAFETADEAMAYYDEGYQDISPLALVAECNLNGIEVVYRHPVSVPFECDQIRPGWINDQSKNI